MKEPIKILIVDDEPDIIEFLKYNLRQESYVIDYANDGPSGIDKAKEFKPDLIILDIMMPGMDGIEVCSIIRDDPNFKNTLIAFLTARDESFTQVSALETGGDDFIKKPIKPNIFKSRVKALLRRHARFQNESDQENVQTFGVLEINFDEIKVTVEDRDISLAKKEFELLRLLVSKPGKVFNRRDILNQVWGHDVIVGDRTIDVHIRKLREKLGAHYIKTFKGIGYKFQF